MRYSIFQIAAGVVLGILPSMLLAQSMPATPTTQPMEQPAAKSQDTRVLVLGFAPAQASDPDWISRAIQQSVVADLSRPTTGQILQAISDSTPVNSTNDAIEAGKKASAKYVVTGNYQMVEPSLKVTGQVIEVESGKIVGGLKSTGSVRELFDIQDRIAGQVRFAIANERLASKMPQPAVAVAPKAPEAPPTIEPLGPVVATERPYDGSDLRRAVADDVSLIDRYDAAGQSYRRQYFDDSYYYSSYPYYGGYGYGSYFNFNFYYHRHYPCQPYKDPGHGDHGHHRNDRSDASTGQNSSPGNCTTADSSPAPTTGGTFNHLGGSIPVTANTNYINNPPNYVKPLYANYVTPQYGNYIVPQSQNYNTAPSRNFNQAPLNAIQTAPSNAVQPPSNVMKPPRQARNPAK